MSRIGSLLVMSFVAGLLLTAMSLLVFPKDKIVIGPSCSVCLDVNGGHYHRTDRGWPLRYWHHDEIAKLNFVTERDGSAAKENSYVPVSFIGDLTLYWAASFALLVVRQKMRKTAA